jgi:hypothetical protein
MSRTNLIVKYAYPEKPEVASRYTLSNLWVGYSKRDLVVVVVVVGGGVSSEREVLPLTFPTFLEKQLKEICQEKKKARM